MNIKTLTIDAYCKSKRIKPNFIKIDAESAEYEILQGMKETLTKYKPMLSLEVGDLRIKGKKNSKDCIYFLKKLGYKPYNYSNDSLVEHIIKKDYYDIFDNLIFIHSSQKI